MCQRQRDFVPEFNRLIFGCWLALLTKLLCINCLAQICYEKPMHVCVAFARFIGMVVYLSFVELSFANPCALLLQTGRLLDSRLLRFWILAEWLCTFGNHILYHSERFGFGLFDACHIGFSKLGECAHIMCYTRREWRSRNGSKFWCLKCT